MGSCKLSTSARKSLVPQRKNASDDDVSIYEFRYDVVDEKALSNVLGKFSHKFQEFKKQKNGLFQVQTDVNRNVKTCSKNVRVVIYVADVLVRPIEIIAGNAENEIIFYINSDGSIVKEWKKKKDDDDQSLEIKTNLVDEKVLNNVLLKYEHRFERFKNQKDGFLGLRNNINGIVKSCAKNVRVVIYVEDVFDQPVEIIAGDAESHINIYIKSDGSDKKEWKKRKEDANLNFTIIREDVEANVLNDVFQQFIHKFEGFENQKQGLYSARDEIVGLVDGCSDNVCLSIFVDDVLDQPIVIKNGEDNVLFISIRSNGTLKSTWKKRTIMKKGKDLINGIDFSKIISCCSCLGKGISCLFGILRRCCFPCF